MSKILAIISEYNPFHNGHLYHLKQSKEAIDADYTVCIMTGNFTQRGEPSLIDKWSKAEIALKMGIDLVIELPTLYSISSAENFAEGSIKILDSLKSTTFLSFGSECGSIDVLKEIAEVLYTNPPEFVNLLNHELAKGVSYPQAREKALLVYLNDVRKFSNILSMPNNILGIEYLKAIRKLKSNIIPITIKRTGTEYNSIEIKNGYGSSSAIRERISQGREIRKLVPKSSYDILKNNFKLGKFISDPKIFEKQIIYKLRSMSIEEIKILQDVTEGLENKIKEAANSCNSIDELITLIKSKRYTQSRIQRILLYSLLNITKKDIELSYKTTPYIRVLGCNKNGKILLSRLASNKKSPVITSVKSFIDKNHNKSLQIMLEKDIFATNIYTLGYEYGSKANLDYTKKLITL